MAAADLPKTMKGVAISRTGGVEVLEQRSDLPVPSPGEGQVLVKNDFIGVNYIDTYFRTGLYPAPSFPYTLGREGGGTIISTGSGDIHPTLKPGTQVAYLAQSAYAEYTLASSSHTICLPPNVSTRQGAAALLQGLTAITLIRDAHHVAPGDWVLVHAASGGMGLWLCQLLKAVGAHVIGTASTPEKRSLAQQYGAEIVLEYPEAYATDSTSAASVFAAKVKKTTKGGAGPIAVYDGVGAATFDASLECVARKGTLVSFGNASGAVPPFSIARLASKNVKLLRPSLFPYITSRQEFEGYAEELMGIVAQGKVDVKVHHEYKLDEVAQAHKDIEGRVTTGKLLLKP